MSRILSVGAIAIASPSANAVGAVQITCAPTGLSIELVLVGSFAAGFVPGPVSRSATFTVPYAAVRGLVRRGRSLWLSLDPGVVAPHNRFTLTRFSDESVAALVGAYRAREIARLVAAIAPVPLALAAMVASPASLVSGILGTLCLGAVIGGLAFVVLREIAEWLAWGGPASDRYRDALEIELSRRLGLQPVHAGDSLDQPLHAEPEGSRFRVTAAVAAAVVLVVLVLGFVDRFSSPVSVPPAVASLARGVAPVALRAAGSAPVSESPPRCTCPRADSPLWKEGLPTLTVIVAPRDGAEEVTAHEDRRGALVYDFDIAAVNDSAKPMKDVRVVVTFARRDRRGERVGATDRGLFAEEIAPGHAMKWRVRGPGSEMRVDRPPLVMLGDTSPPADADAFFALLSARQPVVRMHAAMMLAYLRDPRSRAAADGMFAPNARAERTRSAIARAASPIFACDLARRGAELHACVVNETSELAPNLMAHEVVSLPGLAAMEWPLAVTVPVHDGVHVVLLPTDPRDISEIVLAPRETNEEHRRADDKNRNMAPKPLDTSPETREDDAGP